VTDNRDSAIYLRISLDATGEELAVTRQREDCQKISEARGLNVVGEYIDNDTSASGKVQRPEFDRMLADIAAGRVGTVVSWSMDRLNRTRRDRLRILELGEQVGLLLSFARGSDLDLATPSGRLTADILSSVARHEIEQMSDRRKRANEQRAARGVPAGGRRPFGYTADQRAIVEAEADVVRWCADQMVAGRGLWWLAAQLEERGVRTTLGGPWRHSELRRMLVNPRYIGRRMHRGVDVGEGQWPAILDVDTHTAVRAIISDPTRARKGAPVRYLLSALAVCGAPDCGEVIYGSTVAGRGTYSCATRRHVAVRADPVDEYVGDVLGARMAEPDALGLFVDERAAVDVGELRRREAGLLARMDGLAEAFAADDIDRSQLRAGTSRLRVEVAEVRAAMRPVGVPGVEVLLAGGDVESRVSGLRFTDPARFRDLLGRVAVVRLHSPGRGARRFREESVEFVWRAGQAAGPGSGGSTA